MSSEELADFFVHPVVVTAYIDTTGDGSPLLAAPVTVNGFVKRKQRLVLNSSSETVQSSASITLPADKLIVEKSRVVLPGEARPRIVVATEVNIGTDDIDGLDTAVVYVQ